MLLVSFVIVSQELFQVEVDPETKRPIGTPDPTHPVMVFWFKLLRRYILPALPLIRGNAVCTVDVWNVMRQFEITLRWQLYGEWKTSTYKSHPELRVRQVQTDREANGTVYRRALSDPELSRKCQKLGSNLILNAVPRVLTVMAYYSKQTTLYSRLNHTS